MTEPHSFLVADFIAHIAPYGVIGAVLVVALTIAVVGAVMALCGVNVFEVDDDR